MCLGATVAAAARRRAQSKTSLTDLPTAVRFLRGDVSLEFDEVKGQRQRQRRRLHLRTGFWARAFV